MAAILSGQTSLSVVSAVEEVESRVAPEHAPIPCRAAVEWTADI